MMNPIVALDSQILQTLYAMRDPALVHALIYITELGGTVVVGGISACVGLWLLAKKRIEYLAGLCVSVLGSAAVVFLLKALVHRTRPPAFFQAYTETGASFPSAHAAVSLALYGFLLYIIWRMPIRKEWQIAKTVAVFVLVAVIAFSRLYLGVHFFSDVIGGLAIGALFVWLGILTVKKCEQLLGTTSR